MAKQPINNGKVVERSYEDYRNNQYLVNRRYQRKLVWELEEKQAFIDSLANGYPVPLFLFAKCVYKGQDRSEIIDGMQRLNAVFSFIENDYPAANGEYFDLSTTALTKDLLDSHILEQRQPALNRETCVKIVSYELPYSIYDEHNPDIIDEVFRRINSNGKHLSRQEIRQAGVVNDFSQLVRNIATRIRGDVSHNDFLLLSQMQTISITKDTYHGGIDPESVFWVKENILSKEDLRQSMDEEQIADILGAMLLTPVPPSNVSILDEYYGYKQPDASARYQKIEEALSAISPEKVSEQFFCVYDEIKRVFSGRQKTIITQMVSPRTYRGPRYFQVLFLSMYELLVRQEKRIADYDALYNALDGIGARIIHISGGGGWWSQQEKIDLIAATSGVLAPHFVERGEGDPMLYSYANELETLLKQSFTENTQYDFKQGILTTTVQRNCKTPKKPVVTTNNGLFLVLAVNVHNQQNSRFNASLYHPVVVFRPGRPEVRILPVAPRAAPYGVLLFLFCMDFMEQKKSGFEQPVPRALRPAGQKRPGGAFLGRGLANPFGHTQKPHCNVFLQ